MASEAIAVRIAGKEYRIRSDADEEWLQRVAKYVDESFRNIRERTRTVDSLDVAVLTALNLGQELIELRERTPGGRRDSEAVAGPDEEPRQLAELIDFVEAELRSSEARPQLDV